MCVDWEGEGKIRAEGQVEVKVQLTGCENTHLAYMCIGGVTEAQSKKNFFQFLYQLQ